MSPLVSLCPLGTKQCQTFCDHCCPLGHLSARLFAHQGGYRHSVLDQLSENNPVTTPGHCLCRWQNLPAPSESVRGVTYWFQLSTSEQQRLSSSPALINCLQKTLQPALVLCLGLLSELGHRNTGARVMLPRAELPPTCMCLFSRACEGWMTDPDQGDLFKAH